MFYYNVENRKSPVSGEGLYTLDDIKKGSIVFYWGMDEGDKIISEEEYLEKRKDKSDKIFQKTAARWVHNRFMHCKDWGPDCYINHSFNSNILYYCGIGFAKRDIKKDEELNINYHYILSDKDPAFFKDTETNKEVIGLTNEKCLNNSAKELVSLIENLYK